MKVRFIFPCLFALAVTASMAGAQTGYILQCGTASWYELTSQTANGETANPDGFTAAHKSLPFGTRVWVQNLENGRSMMLRVNDRGPYVAGRIIDVSRAAAERLGFQQKGTTRVRVAVADADGDRPPRACF